MPRRRVVAALAAVVIVFLLWRGWDWPTYLIKQSNEVPGGVHLQQPAGQTPGSGGEQAEPSVSEDDFFWRKVQHQYPVTSFRPLPTGTIKMALDPVQASFRVEPAPERQTRIARQDAIRDTFLRCWDTYKTHAWLHDEVTPVNGGFKDTFGGWGATLVDSLDTLWIMDLKEEFEEAVEAVHRHVSFESTQSDTINIFETTIRFLGGLLAAYDLSGDDRLLAKAKEAGEMIYKAFDTPNHLPVTRWDFKAAVKGGPQLPDPITLLAELGSLSLEFARLSLVTGDPKYYDAIQHITELFHRSQMGTKVPGLWPIVVDAAGEDFDAGSDYSLAGMADSMYEYLPKMLALLGDGDSLYRDMYIRTVTAAERELLFRPMTPDNHDILFPGVAHVRRRESGSAETTLETSAGHLGCYLGGVVALGGRLLSNEHHVDLGRKLANGCIWAYASLPSGVMPESMSLAACKSQDVCVWSDKEWLLAVRAAQEHDAEDPGKFDPKEAARQQRLPRGFTRIADARYILRPEALESVFVMYRITGDVAWANRAWDMWQAIDDLTHTPLASAAVRSVNPPAGEPPALDDSMESFWLGETLKYLYLTFSEPQLVSLDDWVFNTEAHPFKRRK